MGSEGGRGIRDFIRGLDGIRTIPSLLSKILAILRDDRSSPKDLYHAIAHDHALAERVIRVANSAFFGRSGDIRDIGHAILFLGYENIRAIALGMGVLDAFPGARTGDAVALWVHGYEVGYVASAVSEVFGMTPPPETFLYGLVHDIGRVIFYEKDPGAFARIGTGDDMLEREQQLFGCTHAEAGAWYAERMGLPPPIAAIARYHHAPQEAPGDRLSVTVVSLADALLRRFRRAPGDDVLWVPAHDEIMERFSVSLSQAQEIIRRLGALDFDIRNFFG